MISKMILLMVAENVAAAVISSVRRDEEMVSENIST